MIPVAAAGVPRGAAVVGGLAAAACRATGEGEGQYAAALLRAIDRLDRTMKQILRAGTYELLARPDVPLGSVISEYVDVAHAFYDKRESGFVNGLLDAIAKAARS